MAGFSPYSTIPLPATVQQMGLVAENYPNFFAASNTPSLTGGTIYVMRISIPFAVSVTNLIVGITTAGVTLTAAQNFAGLYDINGNQIAITADQSGVWTSAGMKVMPLAGGPDVIQPPFCFAAILTNGTTPPAMGRASGQNIGGAAFSLSTTGSGTPCAINGTLQTALPASLNYAANVIAPAQSIWIGAS